MKTLFFIFITLLLGRCGTDQGEKKVFTYTVKNNTGANIKITSYLETYNQLDQTLHWELSDGEEITRKFKQNLGEGYAFPDLFGNTTYIADSIKVVYNNTKYSMLKGECGPNTKNPLNTCLYNKTEEVYIFNNEDVNLATPCNGNCD